MKQVQQGFTLIELMIVIAIIGILAAVALPAYQDYTIRAKASEGIAMVGAAKTSVSEYFQTQADYPTSADASGINTDPNTDMVASIKFSGSSSGVTLRVVMVEGALGGDTSSSANSFMLSTTGSQGGVVTWTCKPGGTNPMPSKYLPANCRG